MTTFTCSLCGKQHPALPPEPAKKIEPSKIEDLGIRYYAAVDKLLSTDKDVDNKLYERAERLAMEYFQTIRYTGVERVPDTLVSVGPDHKLQCVDHK